MTTLAESVKCDVDFNVVYIENDAQRIAAFTQTFSQMVNLTVVYSREEAIGWLKQEQSVDLIVINDALGGLKFLDVIESTRMEYKFATILLNQDASVDINVQAEGQPTIDVFPLDFDEITFRTRLSYFIRKKQYSVDTLSADNSSELRMPFGKRLFDVVVSSGILLVISPILAVVAILIRLDSKGPVFYKSKRIGMGYQPFYMYKFRTMRTGADKLIGSMASQNMYNSAVPEQAPDERCEECVSANRACQDPLFQDNQQVCGVQIRRIQQGKATFMKFKEDPRVTRLGKFLRNTSIDELPQLLNILKGDMSFVGNRPLPPYEAEKLTRTAYARRFAAPAGLTGLWQVTKRGKAGVSDLERIQLDALYAKTFSFKTDLIILIRTVKAVFQKENV
jgi:lipopolysaccharide/colanic/teichoic acid biosynthesis glycosyltransferase